MEEFIAIPILMIIFGFPLAIIWMHQKHKERMILNCNPTVNEAEVEGLSRIADILDQRVQVLEKILDDEVPGWRESHDRGRT